MNDNVIAPAVRYEIYCLFNGVMY